MTAVDETPDASFERARIRAVERVEYVSAVFDAAGCPTCGHGLEVPERSNWVGSFEAWWTWCEVHDGAYAAAGLAGAILNCDDQLHRSELPDGYAHIGRDDCDGPRRTIRLYEDAQIQFAAHAANDHYRYTVNPKPVDGVETYDDVRSQLAPEVRERSDRAWARIVAEPEQKHRQRERFAARFEAIR